MNCLVGQKRTRYNCKGMGIVQGTCNVTCFQITLHYCRKYRCKYSKSTPPADSDGNKTRRRAQPGDVIPMFEGGFHVNLPP